MIFKLNTEHFSLKVSKIFLKRSLLNEIFATFLQLHLPCKISQTNEQRTWLMCLGENRLLLTKTEERGNEKKKRKNSGFRSFNCF